MNDNPRVTKGEHLDTPARPKKAKKAKTFQEFGQVVANQITTGDNWKTFVRGVMDGIDYVLGEPLNIPVEGQQAILNLRNSAAKGLNRPSVSTPLLSIED